MVPAFRTLPEVWSGEAASGYAVGIVPTCVEGGVIVLPLYRYRWGNNEKRLTMKGRICVVLARGRMNSCLIEFVDDGQQEIVSRNSLRKVARR